MNPYRPARQNHGLSSRLLSPGVSWYYTWHISDTNYTPQAAKIELLSGDKTLNCIHRRFHRMATTERPGHPARRNILVPAPIQQRRAAELDRVREQNSVPALNVSSGYQGLSFTR